MLRESFTSGNVNASEGEGLVRLLRVVVGRIKRFPDLLVIFFRDASSQDDPSPLSTSSKLDPPERSHSPTPSTSHSNAGTSSSYFRPKSTHQFHIFDWLLRYVHRETPVGNLAKEGLLDLFDLALNIVDPASSLWVPTSTSTTEGDAGTGMTSESRLSLAEFILDSDFSQVLGAGIGALYGVLPGKLVVRKPGQGGEEMVLGGLDVLGQDTSTGEREEDELKLRALGVGISGTGEFSSSIDEWLCLVEFMQNVLQRSEVQPREDEAEGEGDDSCQESFISSALSDSILSSLRSLFLQNVLYPSILECSEDDGSATAVLSYLDTLLGVVEEGGLLEATILGFLYGEEDFGDVAQRKNVRLTPRHKRERSTPLVILEPTSVHARKSSDTNTYFDSFGRFTLKDLLVAHLHSRSATTATAACKLLQTLLVKHDRWSLGLLDVTLDETATGFPVVLRAEVEEEGTEEDEFEYPSAEERGASVHRSSETPVTPFATPRRLGVVESTGAPSSLRRLALGTPLPPTPSIKSPLDSLNALLTVVNSIDPSIRRGRSSSDLAGLSTELSTYVHDAGRMLAADLGFQRGLKVLPGQGRETIPLSATVRRKTTLFGGAPTLTGRDFASAKTGFRHRLDHSSKVIGLVLESMEHFFSHPPELNLALTGVLSSLAGCPYRGLEGWMLPMPTQWQVLGERIRRDRTAEEESDDGDDRSVDHDVEELSRVLSPSRSPSSPVITTPCLLSILTALAASVSRYRATVPNFDRYLAERRQGLMFVDDLADALAGNDDGFKEDAGASIRSKGVGFGAFLNSRPAEVEPAPNTFLTPPRQRGMSASSTTSRASTLKSSGGPASPFAAHYRQTGAISVTPIIVEVCSPRGEESVLEESQLESPTKRLATVPRPSNPSLFSDGSEPERRLREIGAVTLSVVLDNVIVLEEFSKELSGILSVRRALGVDGVSFL